MDCRERGSHAQGVYPKQGTSRMRTAGVKLEEEADIRGLKQSLVTLKTLQKIKIQGTI